MIFYVCVISMLPRVSNIYHFEEQYSLYQFKSKYESKMIIDSETYNSRIFWLYNIVVHILFVSVTFDLDFYSHIVPQKLTFVYEVDLYLLLGSPEIESKSLKVLFNHWYFFKWQFLTFVPVWEIGIFWRGINQYNSYAEWSMCVEKVIKKTTTTIL